MQLEEYVIVIEYNSTHRLQQRVLTVVEEVLQYLKPLVLFWSSHENNEGAPRAASNWLIGVSIRGEVNSQNWGTLGDLHNLAGSRKKKRSRVRSTVV